MLGRLYGDEVCSAARALETVGERWSLLIVRNAMFAGATRFKDFERGLGLATNILAKRLERLVEDGIFEIRPGETGARSEYVLTEKGMDLKPVVLALTAWGDRWAAPDGPPVAYRHDGCGGQVVLRMECTACGESPAPAEVRADVAPWALAERAQRRGAALR